MRMLDALTDFANFLNFEIKIHFQSSISLTDCIGFTCHCIVLSLSLKCLKQFLDFSNDLKFFAKYPMPYVETHSYILCECVEKTIMLRLRRLLLMFWVKIMWQAIRSGLKPEKDNFVNIYLVVIPTVNRGKMCFMSLEKGLCR